MSNRRFKKGTFSRKIRFYFLIKLFLHTFSKKLAFCYSTTFFESLITHKRFVFKESYISYGKRQKSCTLIVIFVILSYQTSPTFNLSSKSHRFFLLQRRKYYFQGLKKNFVMIITTIMYYGIDYTTRTHKVPCLYYFGVLKNFYESLRRMCQTT